MLNLARLRVFREVIARGSFSAAADGLNYTQSAVSQAVARLEREVGAVLVIRDRRGVRLTAAGETLLVHAEGIIAAAAAAEEDLAAVLGVRAGRLRVASFPSAGATLLPLAVARFRRHHPAVALSLAEGEPEEIAPRLRAGELDLALLFRFPGVPGPDELDELQTTDLLEDPMHVVVPAKHPRSDAARLTLADLSEEEWVQTAADSPCARHVVRLCRAAGFEPKVTFESDDYETVQGLVAAGVGVALVPLLALTRVRPGVVVRPLAPASPARSIIAATPPGAGTSPAAATMVEILRDVAERYAETVPARAPTSELAERLAGPRD